MAVQIGEKIKNRAKELRIGPTELADLINTSKQNVYGIFKRKSIDAELLKKISIALNYNFFDFYFDKTWLKKFPKSMHNNNENIEELESLKRENSDLKEKYLLTQKLYQRTEELLSLKK